ncbi:MAG: hypothetical protein ACTHQQ_15970 [Solirubrobacteraceae bacterium]
MSISKKLACGILAAGTPLAAAGALALASSPAAASSSKGLPVLTLKMNGSSITVGGKTVSGAVTVRSTVSTERQGRAILIRLNQGVSQAQFLKALKAASKDPNGVQPVGAIVFDSATPKGNTSNVQTVLQPASYVALDVAGKGQPRFTPFSVTKSSSPAKLPAAAATTKAIEFGFRGSSTLKKGTLVRSINEGWVVHMDDFQGVKSAKAGKKVEALLRAGKPFKQIAPYLTRSMFELFGPVSHGAVQQQKLNAKPGYYVEVCFMATQDGRPHTQLGMERLVKVVK